MPRISRRNLDPKVWEKVWLELLVVMGKVSKKDEVEVLLSGLLTRTERVTLAKRLMVGLLAAAGKGPYEIADLLCLSVTSVYKYQSAVEQSDFKKLIKKMGSKVLPGTGKNGGSGGGLGELFEDVWRGYRDRGRLIYGKTPEDE